MQKEAPPPQLTAAKTVLPIVRDQGFEPWTPYQKPMKGGTSARCFFKCNPTCNPHFIILWYFLAEKNPILYLVPHENILMLTFHIFYENPFPKSHIHYSYAPHILLYTLLTPSLSSIYFLRF